MKRKILLLSFLLSCIISMAGNMDKYTVSPVSGAAVTVDDLKHVTLTFPDADGVYPSWFCVYVYDSPEKKGWRLTSVSIEDGDKGKFEGNTVTMDLSEICDEYRGTLYFDIEERSLRSESGTYAPRIEWEYTLPSPFNSMVASPADGATVAPGDFNTLTLTFPDITELKLNDSRAYCGFEIRTVEDDQWIDNDNLRELGIISGNTLTLNVKPEWKPAKACKVKFVINRKALVDCATNIESNQITLIYDIATKQYECTITPSNSEPLPITGLHDLTFTFEGAEKIEIPADITSYDARRVHLRRYTRDGYEDYDSYTADDVTIDGNAVKIYMRVTNLKGGTLTLIADEGAFIIDGNPSQEMKKEYEFLPFATEFDVVCDEKLDAEGRLYVHLPADLTVEYASTQGMTYLKNSDGMSNGFLVIADSSTEDNTAWFTFEHPDGKVLEDGEYYFYLRSRAIAMHNEDGIFVESRYADIYFKKDSASGIHNVRIVTDGKAYTIDGRPATSRTKGIIVVNGVKMVNK